MPDVGPLVAVSAPSVGQAWALAASGAVLRWDGKAWQAVPVTGPSRAHLRGLVALANDDVWAVGDLDGMPMAEHYDGAVWRVADLPADLSDGSSGQGALYAVAGASSPDVWAVGAGNGSPIALHYDGVKWTETTVAEGATAGGAPLQTVAVTASGDAWAAGGELLVRWDGTQWRQVRNALAGPYASVSAEGVSDVWLAAGEGVELWDGAAWQTIGAIGLGLPAADQASVEGVSALAANDAWAVGATAQAAQGQHPLLLHWDGVAWRPADGQAGGR